MNSFKCSQTRWTLNFRILIKTRLLGEPFDSTRTDAAVLLIVGCLVNMCATCPLRFKKALVFLSFAQTAKFGSHWRGGCPDSCYCARCGPPRPHQQLPVQRRKWAGHPLQWHSCTREPPCSTGFPDHYKRWQVQHLQEHWKVIWLQELKPNPL